ncbi:hypothetical protein Dimus_038052 [Dionaea muscipula]
MCPNREWFVDFTVVHDSSVSVGNNNKCMIYGIGNIPLKLNDGSTVLLTKVRFIPELKRNLISLSMLDDAGCSYAAKNGCMVVCKNSKPVLRGIKKHGLYILNGCYSKNPDISDSLVSTSNFRNSDYGTSDSPDDTPDVHKSDSVVDDLIPSISDSDSDIDECAFDIGKTDHAGLVLAESDFTCFDSKSESDSVFECLYSAFGFKNSESFDEFLKEMTYSIEVELATSLDEEDKLATFNKEGKMETSLVEEGKLLNKLINNNACEYGRDKDVSKFDSMFPCAYLILNTLSAALTASLTAENDFTYSEFPHHPKDNKLCVLGMNEKINCLRNDKFCFCIKESKIGDFNLIL